MGNILVQFPESIDGYSTSELYEKFGESEPEAVIRLDGLPLPIGIPAHVFIPGWFGVRSDEIALGNEKSSLATLGNFSTLIQRLGRPRRLFPTFSLPRHDSLMSLSPLPRTFGHLPVLFGRNVVNDLCLTLSGQLPIVSPRNKLKFLASYLPSGGKSGIKGSNGSTKREKLMGQLEDMIACAEPRT